MNEGEPAIGRFMQYLQSGSSDYPVDLLQKAGLDMTASTPYESVAVKLNEYMDMIEELKWMNGSLKPEI